MEKSQFPTFICLCIVALIISSHGHPAQSPQSGAKDINNSIMPPIKKDVFMSRGWGASGMPFTMLYLNHYTKQQKAYAQHQLQQQMQKLREQEAAETDANRELRPVEDELEQPRMLPYGSRYPEPNAQPNEMSQSGGFKEPDEYADGTIFVPSKPSSPRRQYNVPQLFVSYGWGPMG
ncbi:uncharacterized protein LOC109420831 [Aedes albopictus]|uniref:Uncharacterized protein n=1 Tax=Aedes albopictus TaxID=7160 RepID=A0ABM2A7D8_AEDAL|nr:uncharacterized protein LOC109420831 [Aedes albopictus]